jgi:hypothetical protein
MSLGPEIQTPQPQLLYFAQTFPYCLANVSGHHQYSELKISHQDSNPRSHL